MRKHGIPDFPNMVLQVGRLSLPTGSRDMFKSKLKADKAAQDACQPILDALAPSALANGSVSAADLAKLRQFATCMQHHGVPHWPDPKPDGSFPTIGTPLAHKRSRFASADQACEHHRAGMPKGIPIS